MTLHNRNSYNFSFGLFFSFLYSKMVNWSLSQNVTNDSTCSFDTGLYFNLKYIHRTCRHLLTLATDFTWPLSMAGAHNHMPTSIHRKLTWFWHCKFRRYAHYKSPNIVVFFIPEQQPCWSVINVRQHTPAPGSAILSLSVTCNTNFRKLTDTGM